ncbi:hypothetical protein Val02_36720 [Virgisporangium aliadipatigenens]|uniref:DUF6194 domain-containing protein n=1 Tax=Virgisporangium aliadipatigenens TaxID=741659 RepID=A0A8J3YKC9_9ACTN|nr:DUF6194 family protein [Virgisporangium aliadipatigenens]GIJ46786.1 hypothetical protein Val02_36720 [Virgisporangium aliadipatigenens]
MNAAEMAQYIRDTFDGVHVMQNQGDTFFLYDPERDLPPQRQMPFATVVTGDHYDRVSALDRPGFYRLNIGVTKATYVGLLGTPPTERDAAGLLDLTGHDLAAQDVFMPHPYYASQYWLSVINPVSTLPAVREYLAEAHGFAARKHANHRSRRQKP